MFRKLNLILNKLKKIILKLSLTNKSNAHLYTFPSTLQYNICNCDIFHCEINIIFKILPIYNYYEKIYIYFNLNYPNFFFTKFLIKYTSTGFFRIISNDGAILGVRHFVLFNNIVINEISYYLGLDGITSQILSDFSVYISMDSSRRKQKVYDCDRLPAAIFFDVMGFLPDESLDVCNIVNWEMYKDIIYYP